MASTSSSSIASTGSLVRLPSIDHGSNSAGGGGAAGGGASSSSMTPAVAAVAASLAPFNPDTFLPLRRGSLTDPLIHAHAHAQAQAAAAQHQRDLGAAAGAGGEARPLFATTRTDSGHDEGHYAGYYDAPRSNGRKRKVSARDGLIDGSAAALPPAIRAASSERRSSGDSGSQQSSAHAGSAGYGMPAAANGASYAGSAGGYAFPAPHGSYQHHAQASSSADHSPSEPTHLSLANYSFGGRSSATHPSAYGDVPRVQLSEYGIPPMPAPLPGGEDDDDERDDPSYGGPAARAGGQIHPHDAASRASAIFGGGATDPSEYNVKGSSGGASRITGPAANGKLKPPPKETPYSRSPELKVSHKMAERKRRKEMKELFDDLRDSIPAERGIKTSKWEVLSKAIDYIARLHAEREEWEKALEGAKAHIGNLEGMLAQAQQQQQQQQQQMPPPQQQQQRHHPSLSPQHSFQNIPQQQQQQHYNPSPSPAASVHSVPPFSSHHQQQHHHHQQQHSHSGNLSHVPALPQHPGLPSHHSHPGAAAPHASINSHHGSGSGSGTWTPYTHPGSVPYSPQNQHLSINGGHSRNGSENFQPPAGHMGGSAPPVIQTFDQAAAMNGTQGPSQLFEQQQQQPPTANGGGRPPSMHSSSHSIHSIHSVQGGNGAGAGQHSPQMQHAMHYAQQQHPHSLQQQH